MYLLYNAESLSLFAVRDYQKFRNFTAQFELIFLKLLLNKENTIALWLKLF